MQRQDDFYNHFKPRTPGFQMFCLWAEKTQSPTYQYLYLEMSLFPSIFCTNSAFSVVWTIEYVVRSFLPDGVFSTLRPRAGFFTSAYYVIIQSMNQSGWSTPVAQSAPRNLLTRWDVSSIPANGIFLTKNKKNKIKMPNEWRTINSLVHKIAKLFDFTVDEGKEWLNPSRDKNQGTHRRRKVD